MRRSLVFALAFLVCAVPAVAQADEPDEEQESRGRERARRTQPIEQEDSEQVDEEDTDEEGGTDVTICDNAVTIHSTCEQKTVVVVEKPVVVEKKVFVEKRVYVPRRKKLRAIEGEDPPEGYREVMKSRSGIWGSGIAVLGVSYLYSVVFSAIANDDAWGWGFVPVFGAFGVSGTADEAGWGTALVFAGLGQVAGLSMVIGGAVSKRPIWILQDYAKSDGPTTELMAGPGWTGVKVTF